MKYKQITIEEREDIQYMLWKKESIRSIARKLNRSASSILREIRRHQTDQREIYSPRRAHHEAMTSRSSRGREERLKTQQIRKYVIEKLKEGYSPEQISGRINVDLPENNISHEAIYQYIYAQIHRNGYGYIKPRHEDLRGYLKRRHKRRVRKGYRKSQRVSRPKGPSIDDRPEKVEKRIRIGDWETDSIASKRNKAGLNSLVDRKSGYLMLSKLKSKTSAETTRIIVKRMKELPKSGHKTITMDNGSENQYWQEIQQKLHIKCYYAHPYSSWERGTNENTNGLIRWYFPKGTDFSKVSDEEIAKVEYLLNTRPRKRLNYKTPLEVFNQSVALGS